MFFITCPYGPHFSSGSENWRPNVNIPKPISHMKIPLPLAKMSAFSLFEMQTPYRTAQEVLRWCIIKLYPWNLHSFINRCYHNKFNKKSFCFLSERHCWFFALWRKEITRDTKEWSPLSYLHLPSLHTSLGIFRRLAWLSCMPQLLSPRIKILDTYNSNKLELSLFWRKALCEVPLILLGKYWSTPQISFSDSMVLTSWWGFLRIPKQ